MLSIAKAAISDNTTKRLVLFMRYNL